MLEKIYNPEDIEKSHYSEWERSGAFACGKKASAQPFTIVIPPPNVTGSLHMGHALNNTLQDILVRYKRMNGYNVLQPMGFDSFGLPAENYAIKTGVHPTKSIAQNISNTRRI